MGGFGENLRGQRKAKGWSQAKLARRVGVDQNTVSRWERDKHLPRADESARLAKAFGVQRWAVAEDSTPRTEHSEEICFKALGMDERYRAVISLNNWLRSTDRSDEMDHLVMDILKFGKAPKATVELWERILAGSRKAVSMRKKPKRRKAHA